MRFLRRATTIAVAVGAVAVLPPLRGSAQMNQIPVLTSPKGEFQPARGLNALGWEENTKAHPRHYDVFLWPDGGAPIKANRHGTGAAMGDFDGSRLVYQQYRSRRSDLFFYDPATGGRTKVPQVNSRAWEYWPSVSGEWLLFGQWRRRSDVRMLFLHNLETGERRRLDRTKSDKAFIAPGQVNGNYAVWSTCRPRCNVFRYDITARNKEMIPNPGAYQRAPSVTPGGTVYLSRGRKRCGASVSLVKVPLQGPEQVLLTLQDVLDILDTYVYTAANGTIEVLYERNGCGRPAGSDIYMIRETALATLSVSKEGSGAGTVISTPSGIVCGADCAEDYETGTSVALEALPAQGSIFAGWSGSCTGTESCVVTMDTSRSVTATFLGITSPGPATGTAIVKKRTKPPGEPGSFTFTGTPSGRISHGGELVASGLPPGTYHSTEQDPGPGFILTDIECTDDDDDDDGNVATRTATFQLQPGETVTCTFVNQSLKPRPA